MGLFLNLKTPTTQCINGCKLFNDMDNFSYWENKKVTNDEIHVVKYLNENSLTFNNDIMHIGVGNSFLAKNIFNFKKIDGITVSKNEIDYGLNLNISEYNIFFQNKYSSKNLLNVILKSYDIIIDVNLKSYACCDKAFYDLFSRYVSMLKPGGMIITGREGMKWSRFLRPVLSFSIKKFFYKRLKEFDGPNNNFINQDYCSNLSDIYNLSIKTNNDKLIIFNKIK